MAPAYFKIYYLVPVQVLFNFPNGLSFEVSMDAVPGKGEIVSLIMVNELVFGSTADWEKYKEYEYADFAWEAESVIWTPAASGRSYVNVVLKRKL